jgi:hypothetical protein
MLDVVADRCGLALPLVELGELVVGLLGHGVGVDVAGARRPVHEHGPDEHAHHQADGGQAEGEVRTLLEADRLEGVGQPRGGAVAALEADLDEGPGHGVEPEDRAEHEQGQADADHVLAPGERLAEGDLRAGPAPDLAGRGDPLAQEQRGEHHVDEHGGKCGPHLEHRVPEEPGLGVDHPAQHLGAGEEGEEAGDHRARDVERPEPADLGPDRLADEDQQARDEQPDEDLGDGHGASTGRGGRRTGSTWCPALPAPAGPTPPRGALSPS